MLLQPGDTVDRYVVEGALGSGGMAEVYAVRHVILGLTAALKVLRLRSPQLAGRLLREGRAQARLQHPNVVRVLDLLEVDGAPALVMERVDGPTLAQLRARGPLPLSRIDRLLRGVMLGLRAAHQLGIVHRDLKPSNVLVAAGDVPRIADFGLATALLDEGDVDLTRPGTAIGTPAYMAPEQHEDAHQVDARADVFALGVVMYELVAGTAPAAGGNLLAAWQKMSAKRWRKLSELVPGLPGRVDRAVCWALEPDREQRAPSVEALWERWFEEPFPAAGLEAEPERAEVPAIVLPRAAPTAISAIPRVLRPMVGRQRELEALEQALGAEGGWVTLIGMAGVGKTRLAVAFAERWREARKPALWVDLQSAREEQDLLRSLVWLLDERTGISLEDADRALIRALTRRGELLLVLDNFEQLEDRAAERVAGWVAACPSLRVLVTSQRPLLQSVERPILVSPLELPSEAGALVRSAAWELFLSAAPPGTLDHVDLQRMLALLRALDGLPLAIELAAARLEILTIEDLERRLADRFGLLADPDRSGPSGQGGRHGALYSAIDWSWSLLSGAERCALAQLSAFVSPFSLEDAEALVEAAEPALDLLHGLVRRSLVRKMGARFSLLWSVRDFAARKLATELGPSQLEATWQRHARWFAKRALQWQQPEAVGTERTLQDLADAVDELGAVIERAQSRPELAEDGLGCALARALVFQERGPVEGVVRTVERALQLQADTPLARHRQLELRARRATAWRKLGRIDEARAELREVAQQAPSPELEAVALAQLADSTGDEDEAMTLYRRSLALADVHGPVHLTVTIRSALATLLAASARYDEASALLQEAQARLSPDDARSAIELHKARGYVAMCRSDLEEAGAAYRRLRELGQAMQLRRLYLYATGQLGVLKDAMNALEEAWQLLTEAVTGMLEEGDPVFSAIWRAYRARVLARRGQAEAALAELALVLEVQGLSPAHQSEFALLAALIASKEHPEDTERWLALASRAPEPHRTLASLLSQATLAARRGERDQVARLCAQARPLAALADEPTQALALALVLELEGLARAWRIAQDGAWIELPDPPQQRIDLQRHAAQARILAWLARRRLEAPGEPSSAEVLAEAGWPGERIMPSAAANRVRVALSALRRLGLSALLERVEGGWRLSPELPVQVEGSPR